MDFDCERDAVRRLFVYALAKLNQPMSTLAEVRQLTYMLVVCLAGVLVMLLVLMGEVFLAICSHIRHLMLHFLRLQPKETSQDGPSTSQSKGRVTSEAKSAKELIFCSLCGNDSVYPTDWESTDDEQGWWVLLRCGNCEVRREVTITNKVAEHLDIVLSRHTLDIDKRLQQLDRERMKHDVTTMIGALRHNLLDPDDFKHRS